MEEKKFEEQERETEAQEEQQGLPGRSYVFMLLAGAYLIYTGVRLCKDVLEGKGGASWGFFVAGAVFVIIGAGMLFVGGRGTLRKDQEKKETEDVQEEPETQAPDRDEPGKMSISQRARLVKPEEGEEE